MSQYTKNGVTPSLPNFNVLLINTSPCNVGFECLTDGNYGMFVIVLECRNDDNGGKEEQMVLRHNMELDSRVSKSGVNTTHGPLCCTGPNVICLVAWCIIFLVIITTNTLYHLYFSCPYFSRLLLVTYHINWFPLEIINFRRCWKLS